jgi:hypothetical protein
MIVDKYLAGQWKTITETEDCRTVTMVKNMDRVFVGMF